MKPLLLLVFALITAQQQQKPKAPPKPQPVVTFLKWLANATGLSATSSGLKGEIADSVSGDIWCAHIDQPGGGQHLTFEGSYQWPIFSQDDSSIIAIRANDHQLWSIPVTGGDPTQLPHSRAGVTQLVGAGKDGLVLFTGETIGLFHPESGEFTPFTPTTQSDRDEIARLRRSARTYGPNLSVSVDQNKVVIKINGVPHDIASPGERLNQPSASHNGQLVAYIRTKL